MPAIVAVPTVVVSIVKWAVIIGSIMYSRRQAQKIKKSLRSLGNTQAEAQGSLQSRRDSAAYKQVVYGERRVGGTIIFNHNNASHSLQQNGTKHLVIEMADHEVDSFRDLMFDDEVVPLDSSGNATGRFSGYVKAYFYLGAPMQTAIAPLVANCPEVWDADHKLLGTAGVYVVLKHNENLFPNGVPNVTAVCRGKKVYDPRTDLTVWSNNAALCLADYYCDQKRGMGFDYYTEIDEAELIASANVCDELVTLADSTTEKRYTCNGSFTCDTVHADVIDQLKATMGGFTIDPPGRVAIIAGYWRPATLPTFDENTLVAGIVSPTKTPIVDNCNRVKGMFISPENSWQATDYPPVKNSMYLSEDAGKEAWREINYTFVTSSSQAQRLGKIALEEARQGISVRSVGNFAWFQVRAGDVIKFSNTRRGWVEKNFFVEEIGIETADDGTIQFPFTLRETASGIYDWANGEETTVDLAPNTNLPSPFDIISPSNIQVLSDNSTREYDSSISQYTPRILVTWTAPNDAFVSNGGYVRLQFKKASQNTWQDWGVLPGAQNQDYIFPVVTGETYVVRIRSENRLGIKSPWIYSTPSATGGDTTPPASPTGFSAANGVDGIYLTWTNPADSDLSVIEIYESATNTPNPSAGATPLVSVGDEDTNGVVDSSYFRSGLSQGVTRYYWIRAVDSSDNKSAWVGPQGATSIVPMSAVATPGSVDGEQPLGGYLTWNGPFPVATPTGGIAPYSYLWSEELDLGDVFALGTANAATLDVGFTAPYLASGGWGAGYRCRVTDSAGTIAYTQQVGVFVNVYDNS